LVKKDPFLDKRDLKRIKDKDLYETVEEVFDTSTLLTLHELVRRRIIDRMNGVVSAGKESRVYLAYAPDGRELAVKIYLVSTAIFKKGILKYIAGDPRFEGIKPSSTRKLIYAWARKEFRNLKRMYEAGVKVPKPIAYRNNVLVMEFMGENGKRYPLLIEVYNELDSEDLTAIYGRVIEEVEKMVCKSYLIHSDLSEYNIMVKPNLDIVIIDVSQAIDVMHPNAVDFLLRDLRNINRFFKEEAGINQIVSEDEMLSKVSVCLEKRREK